LEQDGEKKKKLEQNGGQKKEMDKIEGR